MSINNNDNGFPLYEISYTSNISNITEGAVIGMTFGWICAIILFYVLGMLLVKKCAKKYLT